MNELVDDLRAQMRAATEHDAAPADLARRARGAVQRRRQRGAVLLTTVAVAGTALLAVPRLGPGEGPRPPVAVQPGPEAPAQGPTDAELARARWFGYVVEAAQPLGGEDAGVAAGLYAGQLWFGADGALVHVREDGSTTTAASTWAWELRGRRLAWDAVRALPEDAAGWQELLSAPGAPLTRGALDEPANLLRGAPLTSVQRRALVQALERQPGVTPGPGGTDARGRAGRVLVEQRDGLRSSYLVDGEDRLLELRRSDGTAERVLTFSGWTTEPPPAGTRPAPADLGPSDEQLARADWYGVRLETAGPDGARGSTRSWVARAGGSVLEEDDGTVTREQETAGWPVGDRFVDWSTVRALPIDVATMQRDLQVAGRPAELVLEDALELLTWAPLHGLQREALGQVVRELDGLVVQPDTADSTGRAAERWELTRPDGTTVQAWWSSEGSRVLEVVRTSGGTATRSTYSGWTVEPPPA